MISHEVDIIPPLDITPTCDVLVIFVISCRCPLEFCEVPALTVVRRISRVSSAVRQWDPREELASFVNGAEQARKSQSGI